MHAEFARDVGGVRPPAASGVVGKALEPGGATAPGAAAAPANDHRLAGKLRVAQQLDGGVERIHVQMRDAPLAHRPRRAHASGWPCQMRLWSGRAPALYTSSAGCVTFQTARSHHLPASMLPLSWKHPRARAASRVTPSRHSLVLR